MKTCPFCGAEAKRTIAPAKGHPMGTYIYQWGEEMKERVLWACAACAVVAALLAVLGHIF